ncbi:MAG: hypothetical protein KDC68_01065 [Gelidibacter sp.]|nr:hypothetical protein [Gelidibacter sp.]
MLNNNKIKFIVTETIQMHDEVNNLYEALMDEEDKDAEVALSKLSEKIKFIREDLSKKEK